MRIAFSFWGYLEKPNDSLVVETPDGLRGERYLLVDELVKRGHEVICVQQRRELKPYPGVTYVLDSIPDVDVAFFEWRWPNKSAVNGPDVPRQEELLRMYTDMGVPIIAQDTDLQVTPEDEQRWPRMVIGDPSFDPPFQTRKRIRMPFCTDFKRYYDAPEYSYNYGYLGNNYDRAAQFSKYYGRAARGLRDEGIQTIVWGNWLNRSAEREDPTKVLREFKHVSFAPRLSYFEGMKQLNKVICTTHIGKDRYAKHGNVTMRVFEAIQCNVPGLIPIEHTHLLSVFGKEWTVDSPIAVVDCVKVLHKMSKQSRHDLVEEQQSRLQKLLNFSPEYKTDLIEGVARGVIKA